MLLQSCCFANLNLSLFCHSCCRRRHRRELKQRRRRRQRERQKSDRFRLVKQHLVHHAFLVHFLPSLHDYNVKVPNFTFCRGREKKDNNFLFRFLNFDTYSPLKFNSKKGLPKFDEVKGDKVWSSTNSLFKWRFCSRRRRCCLSSLLTLL